MDKQIYYLIIFTSKFYVMKETAINSHCYKLKAPVPVAARSKA